jgi:hypothetical protein
LIIKLKTTLEKIGCQSQNPLEMNATAGPMNPFSRHARRSYSAQETAPKPKSPRLRKLRYDLGVGQVLRLAVCESIHIVESHPKIMLVIVTFNVTNVRGAQRVGEFENGVINR